MPRAVSTLGTPEECEAFSQGTDEVTKGWWYHGCLQKDADGILAGKQVWRGADGCCFTRDPHGADQQHGEAVVRAMLHLTKPPDIYYIDDSGITGGFDQIKVYDASSIKFDQTYVGSSKTGEPQP